MRAKLLLTLTAISIWACAPPEQEDTATETEAAVGDLVTSRVVESNFSQARYTEDVRVLSSDEFEGRAPSSLGEEKTINYLRNAFAEAGLEPGNDGSYFQEVPLVEITASDSMALTIHGSEQEMTFAYEDEIMAWTKRVADQVSLEDSELVFVGYGVVAPEYDWDDYAGLDVTGKTVVILVNDPGFATQNADLFNGNAMTYYGRWTYKYEEAARQGAAGAIIVHETEAAGYPWEVVSGSWSGPQFDLVTEDNNFSRVLVEGWVTQDVAQQIFAAAGMDYDQVKTAALETDFSPQPMNLSVSITIDNQTRPSVSNNVIAVLPGSEHPEETIFFTAHWDHLGKRDIEGDNIYNGAADNATGTAALLELARVFAALPERPRRSLVFLAVTAEESGLLGSRYYSTNPIFPLDKTVAVINIDRMNVFGATHDIEVRGWGSSELERYMHDAATIQNRIPVREPHPERGYYYRSDHFNFAKVGVPALYVRGAEDYINHGKEWGATINKDYNDNRYHKPTDEINETWDLAGAVQDMELYFLIAHTLSNEDSYPNWYEGNEFRAIRDASMAQ